MSKTKIEWADYVINPIQDKIKGESGRGYHCTKYSPGCQNCYAETINNRFGNHLPFDGRKAEFELIQSELEKPLKWKKSRSIFIQSMGDLFHTFVPDELIFKVFKGICECRGRHAFLILTKRPGRMANWFSIAKKREPGWFTPGYEKLDLWGTYLGLTVCNQREWDEKGDLFLRIPGKKFISHEPALERIDYGPRLKEISGLIAGGETGAKARPSHPDTFRADRDQCQAAGIDFFFKGWGEFITAYDAGYRSEETDSWKQTFGRAWVRSKRIWRFPDGLQMVRVGRAKSGRILDGRTHDGLPWQKQPLSRAEKVDKLIKFTSENP